MKFPLRSLAGPGLGLFGIFLCTNVALQASTLPTATQDAPVAPAAAPPAETVIVPGPLRSFLRMAGISQEETPPDVLPMLARNVFLHGYEDGKETEFLILVDRYLRQARELRTLAGGNGVIHISDCADAAQLVTILGYRFEHGCSRSDASLIVEDAGRAFLTLDSGFPLTQLEESLQKGNSFSYPYPSTPVPVLFSQSDWIDLSSWRRTPGADLVDVILHDQRVGRLYSAMARLEPHTRNLLKKSPGLRKLLPLAATFDFYGGQICIPGHAVSVPGAELGEHGWQELVGASPRDPSNFVLRLLSRDRGWLAAYFDALSRVSPDQQIHFVQSERLRDLYNAYRSVAGSVVASSGVFPRNASLILLMSRMQWKADGQPVVPGNLTIWQQVFLRDARSYGYRDWEHIARTINTPEQFLEALIATTNSAFATGPAQAYLMISAIDQRRPANERLSEDTVRLLANRFADYQAWYLNFSDFPELDDSAISQFIKIADHISAISNANLRANALGAFQADIGVWKILARQHEIPASALNASWHKLLEPFAGAEDSLQIFDAARASLGAAVTAAGGSDNLNQDEVIDLLAGPPQKTHDGQQVHDELADRIRAVLSDQRLASLDTLFGLYDGLDSMAHGEKIGDSLLPLAQSLHEFEMPRPIFTGGERAAWSPLIYTSRHAELQIQTNLAKVIKEPHEPRQLEAARGRLTPFLRDTLVGLNYAYYEPPGAQVLHNNPLFVRSHDFAISSVQGLQHIWGPPELIGIGATAGGGAYLIGSLAGLPYALAAAEEDFISPQKVQALIWRETVPELLVEAVQPRWWGISSVEMHAAALYQRAGEELVIAAQTHPDVREKVLDILSERFTVERLEKLENSLDHSENSHVLLRAMLPSDLFYLTVQFRRRFPDQAAEWGPAGRELDALARTDAQDTDPVRLASDFGVPHPTLTETDDCSLLKREPFPVSGGFASRLFGESWESSNLYWARMADEMNYSPVMLNVLVPELTHRMIANIFATYVDDWGALRRAMVQTGTEFKEGKLTPQQAFQHEDDTYSPGSASE